MDNIIKSVGYVRLSPDDKKKGEEPDSIVNQKETITEFCKRTGRNLIKIYDQDQSITGSDRYRPDFIKMIGDGINNKLFNEIIIKKTSRFCRDIPFLLDTLSDLELYNIKVFSIFDNRYLDSKDIRELIGGYKDRESVEEGKREYASMFERKKENGLPSTSPPFGYYWKYKNREELRLLQEANKVSKEEKNVWVIDNKKAEIIREVYNLLNSIKPKSQKEISLILNISKDQVRRIIKSKKIYEGFIVINRIIKSNTGKYRKEQIIYKGNHIPILK